MDPRRASEQRHCLALTLATLLFSLLNLLVFMPRIGHLSRVMIHSPAPAAYPFFLIVLAPLFFLACTLLGFLLGLRGEGPMSRKAVLLDWAGTLLLPALGAACFLQPDPGRLFWLQGPIYLLAVLLRLLGLLVRASSAVAAASGPRAPAAVTFAVALVVYLGLSFWMVTTASTTGDEPYYLMEAESFARDRDASLDNQFTPERYRFYYWKDRLASQNMIRTPSGLRSTAYATLFPLILAPGSLLHPRWGPTMVVILISALLSAQIFLLCRDLTGDSRASLVAWALASFSLPLAAFSSQIYPETAAALLSVILFRLVTAETGKDSPRREAWIILTAILLPALKMRYLPISLALLGVHAWRFKRARRGLTALGIFLLGLAALAAVDYYIFGGAMLFSRFTSPSLIFKLRKLWRFGGTSLLGLFADQEFGLLFHSPIYFLLPAGLYLAARRGGRGGLVPLLPAAAYLAVLIGHFGHLWYGGFSQPSRYLVAILPLLAPFLAWVWKECRGPALAAFAGLAVAWSALVTLPYCLDFSLRYNRAVGVNALLSLFDRRSGLPFWRAFPSLMNPSTWSAPRLAGLAGALLLPSLLLLLIRRRRPDSSGERSAAGAVIWSLLFLSSFLAYVTWSSLFRPTGILEAESMSSRAGKLYTGLVKGPVRVFKRTGWVEGEIATASARTELTVTAGVRAAQAGTSLTVVLDGKEAGTVMLQGGEKRYLRRDYHLALRAAPGRHIIRVIVNPLTPPGEGDVYLDRLTFRRAV